MDMKRFMFFNFLGGTLWVWGLGLTGYFLGSLISDIDKYLLPSVVVIVLISTVPPLWHLYKEQKLNIFAKTWLWIKRTVKYEI